MQEGQLRVLQACSETRPYKLLVERPDHGPARWEVKLYVVHGLGLAIGQDRFEHGRRLFELEDGGGIDEVGAGVKNVVDDF